jgi:hypothetical protein
MNSSNRLAAIFLMLMFSTTNLDAQEPTGNPLCRLMGRIRQHHARGVTSTQPVAAVTAAAPIGSGCECGSDPYGFTAILNRLRASAGLHAVAYDPNLSSWASQNNAVQCRRGIGHHVNPCGVQNCGWNYSDASSVAQGWMQSPGHRQNMLSPSITHFGIAFGPGPYWTLNAR